MNDIRTLLKTAAHRMEFSAFLGRLHLVAIVLASLGLLLMLIDRMPAEGFMPWKWALPIMAALGLGVAAVLWSQRRLTELKVATAVDDRLQLRERLSTALHCRDRDDAFAQAAVEDAVTTARDKRNHERIRRQFKVAPPPGWWISPLIVFVAIMATFLPQGPFINNDPDAPEVIEARRNAEASVEAVVKAIEEKPALSKELSDMLGELSRDGVDFDQDRAPEEVRRDAIKKVTDINRKLDEILNGERGKTSEALERNLQQLKSPADGEAKELADALAAGDFKAAKQSLEDMMAKLQNGEMSKEQQEKLAEQLKSIGDQLQKLAENQQQLEEALKQAGLNPQLAANPQALQQALQNNPNLNEQQRQQLQQMAQAQQAAAQMCQGLGQACQQMAGAMGQGQQGQQGQMGQAGQQMGQQLSQMEQMQMLLQEAQAAMNACQGQCQGLGQGLSMKPGNGAFGGQGQGRGGKAPIAPTPTGSKIIKADTKMTPEGGIIAKQLFDGPQIRGESTAQMRDVVKVVDEGYDEALNEDELPRRYHESQMHYFGELKKLTEAIVVSEGDEAEAEGSDDG